MLLKVSFNLTDSHTTTEKELQDFVNKLDFMVEPYKTILVSKTQRE